MHLPRKMSQGGADSKHAYNALGRPVSRSGDAYLYNARSEVAGTTLGGVGAAYSYDAAGNRTAIDWEGAASAYTANGLNQYVSVVSGGVTNALAYDAWGNLTDTSPFRFTYSYAGNLLVGVDTNRANGVRSYADYDYDAQQRRAYKYVHPPSGPNRSHWYFHSGWSLQTEQWRQGNSGPYNFVHYVWGADLSGTLDGAGGVGGLLATEVNGLWYFPLCDANGNVAAYVSETGEVVASYTYDAFGRTIAKSGTMADTFPFRFSTKYYDAETGLYYYGYRYYSPELGRWTTRDPIEEDGGDNLYAFCENSPVNAVDAYGTTTIPFRAHRIRSFLNANLEDYAAEEAYELYKEIIQGGKYLEPLAAQLMENWLKGEKEQANPYAISARHVKKAMLDDKHKPNVRSPKSQLTDKLCSAKLDKQGALSNFRIQLTATEGMYYHAFGTFTIFFSGTYKCRKRVRKFKGTWVFDDDYDWHDGLDASVLGIPIEDSWALLVEKYKHAKSFKEDGVWEGAVSITCSNSDCSDSSKDGGAK